MDTNTKILLAFAAAAAIWLIIKLIQNNLPAAPKAEPAAPQTAPAAAAPVAKAVPAPVVEAGIPPEVVAAIAAAVAAMDGGKYTLRAVSRRHSVHSSWKAAAIAKYTRPF